MKFFLLPLLFVCCTTMFASSVKNETEIQKVLEQYSKISNTNEGCTYLFKHKDLLEESAPSLSAFRFTILLSSCFYEFYDGMSSIDYIFKAKKMAEQFSDVRIRNTKIANIYYQLAFKYYDKLEFSVAEKYIDSTLLTLAPLKIKNLDYANVIAMKGRIYGEKENQLDSALFYLKKAGVVYKDNNFTRFVHKNIRTQGKMYLINGKPLIALQYYKKALQGFITTRDLPYIKGTWLRIFQLLLENPSVGSTFSLNDTTYSLRDIKEHVRVLLGNNSEIDHYLHFYRLMNSYYSGIAEKDSLLVYQNKMIVLQSKIQKINSKNKLRVVDVNITETKIKMDISYLLSLVKEYQYLTLFGSIGVLILVVSGFYYFKIFKNNKRKNDEFLKANIENLKKSKTDLELQLKNKEQVYLKQYLELNKKNTTLQNIEEQLNKNVPLNVIKNSVVVDKAYTNFKSKLITIYQSVGDNYIEKLKQKHPNLTKQDINYCILIVLEFSTQDIAELLKSNPKAVNQHKYRLKKKLDFTTKENLFSYLKRIF